MIPEWLDRVIDVRTPWEWLQICWIIALGFYFFKRQRKKEQWFTEPITVSYMPWEYAFMAVALTFVPTDLQLDGVLLVMKRQIVFEWWKKEKKVVSTMILLLSTLFLILTLSPYLGEWIVG